MFAKAITGVIALAVVQIITGLFIDLILDALMVGTIFWLHKRNQA